MSIFQTIVLRFLMIIYIKLLQIEGKYQNESDAAFLEEVEQLLDKGAKK